MASASPKNYILRETAVATLFNMAFSFGFAYLFFRALEQVPQNDLVVDAIPQSFAVTFFGVLIPSLIARGRIRAGQLAALPSGRSLLPANLFLRVIAMAAVAAIAGAVLHLVVLRGLQIDQLARDTVLIYKPAYGALLTWVVTPVGLRSLLSQSQED